MYNNKNNNINNNSTDNNNEDVFYCYSDHRFYNLNKQKESFYDKYWWLPSVISTTALVISVACLIIKIKLI